MSRELQFLVCGEGPSDVGYDDKNPGILMKALETLGETVISPTDTLGFHILSRLELARSKSRTKGMVLRGGKNASGENKALAALRQQARILGELAQEREEKDHRETGAVLFHDCDFTQRDNTKAEKAYQDTVSSIERGFASAKNFRNGVAMVPCTRSECWLLAHYQNTPYQNSQRFEKNPPGNDASPNSPKKLLANFLKCPVNDIYSTVDAEAVQWEKIDSPSFRFFRKRYRHVLQRMLHLPTDDPEEETLISRA